MYLDKEFQIKLANAMLHTSLLAYSTAEDIKEDYPERAEQLKDINELCGQLFNIFNPKEGIKLEIELGE